jgi:hypothetical protein
MRMRWGRMSRIVNVLVWLVAGAIVLTLGVLTCVTLSLSYRIPLTMDSLVVAMRWDTALDNAYSLSDALGHAATDGLTITTADYNALTRANDLFGRAVEQAVAAMNAQAGFGMLWLVLTAVVRLSPLV